MAKAKIQRRAYSYIRFSTPEQAAGDSLRRQTEAAAVWIARHPEITLDEQLTLRDIGVSAYSGKNIAAGGALHAFHEAVRTGAVAAGSYLLVENLDRLSRADVEEAQYQLLTLMRAGIVVVTLADGREYRQGGNWTDLLVALAVMARANEESVTKGKRVREAWRQLKTKRAREGVAITKSTPGWIRWVDGKLELIPERAEIVRRIFDLAATGLGQRTIADQLTREGVPCFGKAKRWGQPYIFWILNSGVAEGRYTPQTYTQRGKRGRTKQSDLVVEDYYPRAVTPEQAAAVRALRDGRVKHSVSPLARRVVSPLAQLARCPKCGSRVTLNTRSATSKFLVCALRPHHCDSRPIPFRLAEIALAMPTTVQAMIDQLCPLDDGRTNDGAQIELAIQANEAAEAGVIDQQEALMSSLDTTRDTAARTALIARVADRQKMIAGLQEERRRLEDQLSGATRGLLGGRLEALREELAGDKKRSDHAARVNLALRALFSKIEIDRPKNEMRFYWRHVPGQFAAVTLDPFAA